MSAISEGEGTTAAAGPVAGAPRVETVVVGVDGTPSSSRALEWAASLLDPGGKVVAVHAVSTGEELVRDATPFGSPNWRRDLRHQISERWCAGLRQRGVHFDVQVVERGVPHAILKVAEDTGADLIVVGAHRHHDRVIRHQATLAAWLDHRADVPVLCVPTGPPVPAPDPDAKSCASRLALSL